MNIETYLTSGSILGTIAISLTLIYIVNFYSKVRKYPKGPFPLPLLGNLVSFSRTKNLQKLLDEWTAKYDDPMTFWIGSNPTVVISNPKNINEIHSGERKTHFAGRSKTNIGSIQTRGNDDIFFNDMDLAWDALRKVAIRAIRKYANSESLAQQAAKTTITEIDLAAAENSKSENGIDIIDLVEAIVEIITIKTAYGIYYRSNDPELVQMRHNIKDLQENAQSGLPSDISPILGYIMYRKERFIRLKIETFVDFGNQLYERAKNEYQAGRVRNFTEAMQAAKDEAVIEERSIAEYLTEGNLRQCIFLLFGAGMGGARTALIWAFLYLARHNQVQEQLHDEVISVLGKNGQLTAKDRHSFPRVESFLAEILRVKPPAPVVALHKTMCDTDINGVPIPKNTSCMINIETPMKQEEVFPQPEKFVPDRFIDKENERYVPKKAPEYTAFGIGPRACPGEKLAITEMIYILVTTLQHYQLTGLNGPESVNLNTNPKIHFGYEPSPQKLIIRRHE